MRDLPIHRGAVFYPFVQMEELNSDLRKILEIYVVYFTSGVLAETLGIKLRMIIQIVNYSGFRD